MKWPKWECKHGVALELKRTCIECAEERGYQRGIVERDAEVKRLRAALGDVEDACAADENTPYIQSLAQDALAATGAKSSAECSMCGGRPEQFRNRQGQHVQCPQCGKEAPGTSPRAKTSTEAPRLDADAERVQAQSRPVDHVEELGTSPRAEPIHCECGDILETAAQYETHRKISHPDEDSPHAAPPRCPRGHQQFWPGDHAISMFYYGACRTCEQENAAPRAVPDKKGGAK